MIESIPPSGHVPVMAATEATVVRVPEETVILPAIVTRHAARTQLVSRMIAGGTAIVDLLIVNLAFVLAYIVRYVWRIAPLTDHRLVHLGFSAWSRFELLLSVVIMVSLGLAHAYRQKLSDEWIDEAFVVLRAVTVGMAVMIVLVSIADPDFQHSRGVIVYTWVLLLAMLVVGRVMVRYVRGRLHRTGWGIRRVLVAGATPMGRVIMQNMLRRRNSGYELIGFVAERSAGQVTDFGRFKGLGSVEQIGSVVRNYQIDEVIIALPSASHDDIARIRQLCEQQNVAFKLVPDLFDLSLSRVQLDGLAGIPLISVQDTPLHGVNRLFKRALDIAVSGAVLLVVSPILAIVALAIRLDSPGPIILAQERVGRSGKIFKMYKFRSMDQNADAMLKDLMALNEFHGPHFKLRNDPRRTRIGRIIRPLSIDELPQFWNVLRGDMSVVGPRPPLPREVQKYEPWHLRRLDAQPGITGLWQVSGRNSVPFDEMVVMDCYYIDNWSISLDFSIMARTVGAALTMNGAS